MEWTNQYRDSTNRRNRLNECIKQGKEYEMIQCWRNREQKKRMGRVIVYSCCMILYTCRAHRYALFITAVERERGEEEDALVLWQEEDVVVLYYSYGSHWMIHIIHRTWNIILIATSSPHFFVTLSSVYQVIRTNMTPSYRTINSITQLYVYAWNNSVAIVILGRKDGHGHGNKFNK